MYNNYGTPISGYSSTVDTKESSECLDSTSIILIILRNSRHPTLISIPLTLHTLKSNHIPVHDNLAQA